jgi:hypothetical protein
MALVERQLEEIVWEKPGTKILGHLIRAQKVKYSDGSGIVYLMRKAKSGVVFQFKGTTKLNNLIHSGDMGKLMEITFVGTDGRETRAGMSPAKMFRVAVDDEDKIAVTDQFADAGITDDDIPF